MITVMHLKGAYDQAGGPETLVRHILGSLSRERFNQQVVIVEHQAGFGADTLRSVTEPTAPLTSRWYGLALAPWATWKLRRLIREHRVDIIHTHDMRTNLMAYLFTRMRRIGWVASVHGWLGHTHTRRGRMYEWIESKLVRGADAVMVGSMATKADVEAGGARNVHVIHHGIPLPDVTAWQSAAAEIRRQIGAGPATVVIGVVARIHPGKGLRSLVEALAGLIQQGHDVAGVLVGEGPERASLQQYIDDRQLQQRIRLTGFVDEPNPWLVAMDVVALPTLQDSFPFSVLDGLAMGKPVVTTSVGDLPLAVDNGRSGFVVPPGDTPALQSALQRLVSDAGLRASFGEHGRATIANKFSPQALGRKLADMYDEVLMDVSARRELP